MAINLDFKQTYLGAIPSDWSLEKFKDVTNLITCGVAATPKYANESTGRPFLSAQNVQNGRVVFENFRFIDKELFIQLTKHNKPSRGDILYTRVGAAIGEAGIIESDLEFAIYVSLTLIKVRKNKLNSSFLSHLLNSDRCRLMAKGGQFAGGGVQNLNVEIVREFPIPIPSLPEQQSIATALSDADAYIESLERLITKKRDLKKGVIQELLKPNSNWHHTTLLALCDGRKDLFDDGDWIESEHITEKGIRLIQTGNIGLGRYLEKTDKKYIYEKSYDLLNCKSLQVGDLLICRLAEPAGRGCILPNIGEDRIITSVDVTICRPLSHNADRRFLAQYFTTDMWLRLVSDRSGGTTHKRIARGSLGSIKFEVPDVKIQTEIADILCDIDTDITTHEEKLYKARLIKQGMMQALLTGRIRLV
ncbi:MAG: restriction endonuclease subunit S [Deltaproteobacteria bacterium]|nr:MAG: restriction endonuclease subunit S [Deltaproteobacteria bacterium]